MIDPCLHCAIVQIINDHAREHGPKHEGTGLPVLNLHEALTSVAQVLGGLVAHLPEEDQRRGAISFAGRVASETCFRTRQAEGIAHESAGLH